MKRYKDVNFNNSKIRIDGNSYEDCVFTNCELIYEGSEVISFINCNFESCNWSFRGAASNTINFLRSLYHGIGDDGKMIESLFTSIRNK